MKSAILLSNRIIEPHHCHFLAKLQECTEIVGAISFVRKGKRRRLLKRTVMRNPLQLFALMIGHYRNKKVTLARQEAFKKDKAAVGNIKNLVDVMSSKEAAEIALNWEVDFLFRLSAGFIREPLLSATQYGVLSFHHGIMPLLRGLASPFWALYLNRPDYLGITLQRLNEQLDGGTILAQSTVPVKKGDSFADVTIRIDRKGADMIKATVEQLETREKWLDRPLGKSEYYSHPNLINQLLFNKKFREFKDNYSS